MIHLHDLNVMCEQQHDHHTVLAYISHELIPYMASQEVANTCKFEEDAVSLVQPLLLEVSKLYGLSTTEVVDSFNLHVGYTWDWVCAGKLRAANMLH